MIIKKYFVQIPHSLIREKKISDGAFRTLLDLMSYRNGNNLVFPSQKRIAKDLDISIRTVITHLKELNELGIVSWQKTGYAKPNLYSINDEKYFTIDGEGNCIIENNCVSIVKEAVKTDREIFHPNNNKENNLFNNRGIESLRKMVDSWNARQ